MASGKGAPNFVFSQGAGSKRNRGRIMLEHLWPWFSQVTTLAALLQSRCDPTDDDEDDDDVAL